MHVACITPTRVLEGAPPHFERVYSLTSPRTPLSNAIAGREGAVPTGPAQEGQVETPQPAEHGSLSLSP